MLSSKNLILVVFLGIFSASFGQNWLEKKVTLSAKNQTFAVIFKSISEQTGVIFSYSNFNDQARTSYSCQEKKLDLVLKELIGSSAEYRTKGKYIIIQSKKVTHQTAEQRVRIVGKIVDLKTNNPISDASVFIKSNKYSTLSDVTGNFSLVIPKTEHGTVVSVAKIGYIDTTFWVDFSINAPLEISMKSERKTYLEAKTTDSIYGLSDTVLVQQKTLKQQLDSLEYELTSKGKAFWNSVKRRNENFKNINDTLFTRNAFSIFPPLSTNRLLGLNTVNQNAFHLLVGQSKGIENFEFAGLVNIDAGNVQYFQFAGLANLVKGDVRGFQMGGITNINSGSFRGTQIGGIYNHQMRDFRGMQLGGIANYVNGEFKGTQIAGITNVNLGKTAGFQLAGISNVNRSKTFGTQLAGISNHADTLFGFQLSGILNQANEVFGFQLGFINVSNTIHGTPIGFFSYSKTGYHKLELGYDEQNMATVAFRTGVNHFHNIFLVGAEVNSSISHLTVGYGIGSSLRLSNRFYLGLDLIGQSIQSRTSTTWNDLQGLTKAYLGLEYRLTEKLNFFAGPTFNLLISDQNAVNSWTPSNSFSSYNSGNVNLKTWAGFKVGMRFW